MLNNGARPHIEDIKGKDACDYARDNHIYDFQEFLECREDLKEFSGLKNSKLQNKLEKSLKEDVFGSLNRSSDDIRNLTTDQEVDPEKYKRDDYF